ncbi:TlpA family protein disulfide reductase [Fulvitalea axinellae]
MPKKNQAITLLYPQKAKAQRIRVHQNGDFKIGFENYRIYRPKFVQLDIDDQGTSFDRKKSTQLFIDPTHSLELKGNYRNFPEGITFTGPDAEVNNFLAKFTISKRKKINNANISKLSTKVNVNAFLDSLDLYFDHLEDEILLGELPKKWKTILSEELPYEKAGLMIPNGTNPRYHNYYASPEFPEILSLFEKIRNEKPFCRPELAISYHYQKYLNFMLDQDAKMVALAKSANHSETDTAYHTLYAQEYDRLIQKHFKDSTLNFILNEENLIYRLEHFVSEGTEEVYNRHKNQTKDTAILNYYSHVFKNIKALSPGKPLHDATFTNIEGDTVSISSLITDGALFYVWLGRNGLEQPNEKELMKILKEYEDKGLKAVGLCFNGNRKHWEETIKKHKVPGESLFSGHSGQAMGFIEQHYFLPDDIRKYPRLILIGKNGKIIKPRLPQPGMGLRRGLEKFLKEKV